MGFFNRYKKIFALVGFIAFVGLMGYLLFSTFFKSGEPVGTVGGQNQTNGTGQNQTGGLPNTSTGSIGGNVINNNGNSRLPGGEENTGQNQGQNQNNQGQAYIEPKNNAIEITQKEAFSPTLGTNGSVQYYNKEDGKFYKIDKNGNFTLLSDKTFYNVDKITWSPNKNEVVLEYPDGANTVYNFETKKQVTLPNHWQDFGFSPKGDQLVFKSMGMDPDNQWLAITNTDGSRQRKIESIAGDGSKIYDAWSPNNQMIAMYAQGVDFDRQEVFFVGQNKENFKSMIVEGRDFQPKWSPSGDKLLYSAYSSKSNMKPSLWIANAKGDAIGTGRKSIGLETWAEKCTFKDATKVYCAVPEKLDEGAGLFPEMAQNTKDKLYEIDLNTGSKSVVSTPEGGYNMSNLIISDDGKSVFFTDANSKKLYKVNIK